MASSAKQTEFDKAMRRIETILTEQYQNAEGILRQGDRIVLPERGTLDEHIETLTRYRDALDEMMNTDWRIDAHPDDGLFALYTVIEQKFGKMMSAVTFTFFGPRPGQQQTIRISATETKVVPIGKAEIFGSLPITLYVNPEYDSHNDVGGYVNVTMQHPRKWAPFVKDIQDTVNEWIRGNSIFKGKAINNDFSFLDLRYFNPERRIVYSHDERIKLFGEVFAPIIATRQWLLNGGSLKRGALLYGDFGTGKSLTLMYIAKLCEKHGWTFINVKPGGDINQALRFAKRYQPAVVAVEDIDRETGRERTDDVNKVVNQFDSVVSKGDQVMVVMTTNNKDTIQPAMLRPGRIDTSVEMGILDEQAVTRLVMNELLDEDANSMLVGELDSVALFAAANCYTAAFVNEGVRRAKGYAIARRYEDLEGEWGSDNGHVTVTSKDIENGLIGLRAQWKLMRQESEPAPAKLDDSIREIMDGVVGEIRQDVDRLTKAVGVKKEK